MCGAPKQSGDLVFISFYATVKTYNYITISTISTRIVTCSVSVLLV